MAMSVQLKAIFLILLIGSVDAHRIQQQSGMMAKIRHLASDGLSKDAEATAGTMSRGCDNDVVVEARWFVDGHKRTAIGRLRDLANHTTPVLVGSKTRDGCKKSYSLLCQDDTLVLRKDKCDGASKDKAFGWLMNWESSAQKSTDSVFKFDPAFLDLSFPPDTPKDLECKRVLWTATQKKCDSTLADSASTEESVSNQIDDIKAAQASGEESDARTAVSQLFQKLRDYGAALSSSRQKGCFKQTKDPIGKTAATKESSTMTSKVRDLYISTKSESIGTEAAAERFDKSLEMMKESSRTRSMKGLMKAVRLALKGHSDEVEKEPDEVAAAEDEDLDEEELEELVESKEVQEEISKKFDGLIAMDGSSLLQTSIEIDGEVLLATICVIALILAIWFTVAIIAMVIAGIVVGYMFIGALRIAYAAGRSDSYLQLSEK